MVTYIKFVCAARGRQVQVRVYSAEAVSEQAVVPVLAGVLVMEARDYFRFEDAVRRGRGTRTRFEVAWPEEGDMSVSLPSRD